MLEQEDINKLKEELEGRRDKLMEKIASLSVPHNEENETVRPNEEEADEAEDFSNQLAAAQALRDEVQEIDLALSRIADGSYEKCSKCGAEIEKEVLRAAPESILCEKCKLEE